MKWKLIWRSLKSADMRNKLLAVFGILIVYRLLSHIPIPLAEPTELKQLIDNLLSGEGVPQLLSFINVLSGGALASLSIMLVGLGPYINASIVMQVLSRALPKLEKMQKEGGEYGRKKINQYTRILTLPLAIIQSVLAIFLVRQLASQVSGLGDITAGATWSDWLLMIASLTAGAMILMWLGELITERSIGNGISLLITVAIVSQLPFMATSLYNSVFTGGAVSDYGVSSVISNNANIHNVNVIGGSDPNALAAQDTTDLDTVWHYVAVDESLACSSATDFANASPYAEGEDVALGAFEPEQRLCFRSQQGNLTSYGLSPPLATDRASPPLIVFTDNRAQIVKASGAQSAAAWSYVALNENAVCGSDTDFSAATAYSADTDITYSTLQPGQKLCFRVIEGSDFSVFGWFSLPVDSSALWYTSILLASVLLLTIFIVYLNEAHRKIRLNYAKKIQGNRVYSDVTTFLPLKLIAAGVVPIIFALAFLSVPQFIGQIIADVDSPFWSELGTNFLTWFAAPGSDGTRPFFDGYVSYIYPVAYFLLVVLFTYFYTSIVFSAKDISERLQRQGGFIEGVRPGEETQKYLSSVVGRLNFFGSISLGFLALTPILAQAFLGTSQLALGGTSLLILVAVSLETLRQIESKALMVTYEDYDQNFKNRDKDKDKDKKDKRRLFSKKGFDKGQ